MKAKQLLSKICAVNFSRCAQLSLPYVVSSVKTTHSKTGKFYDGKLIENWARANVWQKLEIILKTKGTTRDKVGTVEFKA